MAGRDVTSDDFDEIKAIVAELRADLRQGYVPRELYEAKHEALRAQQEAAVANVRQELAQKASVEALAVVSGKTDTSYRLSWGVFILMGGCLLTILVAVLKGVGG